MLIEDSGHHRRRGTEHLHHRPLPAGQGHRPDRRAASKLRMEIDSKPEELDEVDRRVMQLEIEREAIKREKDEAKLAEIGRSPSSVSGATPCRPVGRASAAWWSRSRQRQGGDAKTEVRRRPGRARGRLRQGILRPHQGLDPRTSSPRSEEQLANCRPAASMTRWRRWTWNEDCRCGGALDRHPGEQDARKRTDEAAPPGGRTAQTRDTATRP